jgi:hypothetical protein
MITSDIDFEIKLVAQGFISRKDIVEDLRLLADSMSTHKALAKKIGISPQFLCDILAGKRLPGKKVCNFLKVEPILVYREIKNDL